MGSFTPLEMASIFGQAADKENQIRIFCQTELASEEDIVRTLCMNGVDLRTIPKKYRQFIPKPLEDAEKKNRGRRKTATNYQGKNAAAELVRAEIKLEESGIRPIEEADVGLTGPDAEQAGKMPTEKAGRGRTRPDKKAAAKAPIKKIDPECIGGKLMREMEDEIIDKLDREREVIRANEVRLDAAEKANVGPAVRSNEKPGKTPIEKEDGQLRQALGYIRNLFQRKSELLREQKRIQQELEEIRDIIGQIVSVSKEYDEEAADNE